MLHVSFDSYPESFFRAFHEVSSTAAMNVDFHSSGNDIHSFGVDKFSSNNCKGTIGYFQNFVVANKH